MFYQHDIYLDKAHSSILEVFATTGIIGLSIYLCIIIYVLRRLFLLAFQTDRSQQLWYKTILLVFLLFLFHSQTNVISIAEELYFWFVIGVLANENIYSKHAPLRK